MHRLHKWQGAPAQVLDGTCTECVRLEAISDIFVQCQAQNNKASQVRFGFRLTGAYVAPFQLWD